MHRHALLAALALPAIAACTAHAQPKPAPLGSSEADKPSVIGPIEPIPGSRPRQAAPTPAPRPRGEDAAWASLPKPPPLSPEEARREISSGTGFVVAPRRVLTNHHVVESCGALRLRGPNGSEVNASVVNSDRQRDLALLSAEGDLGPPLPFRDNPPMRRGEGVVTYGFPLAGLLSSGPTLTTGEVSALAGLSNNQQQFQISAPVQPGNSGGPLFDLSGNVVGIVVSKLNAQRVAQSTGDIPQNVNFAVKGEVALGFLRENNVQPRTAASASPKGAAEVGEIADPSTLFVRCLR